MPSRKRAAAYYRARSRALVRLSRDYDAAYRAILEEERRVEDLRVWPGEDSVAGSQPTRTGEGSS